MRHLLPISVVLATSTASAQPVTRPEPRAEMCGVTFVRAPDEVRYAIESYLRDEPRCSSSIELRVVSTEGGFYLIAQRPDGRIHERLVPDLQSAGVLVASWVADDWTQPAPAPSAPPVHTTPTTVAPSGIAAPGAMSVVTTAAPRDTKWHKWLTLGTTLQANGDGRGFRFEADVFTSGAWSAGAVVEYAESRSSGSLAGGGWLYDYMATTDFKLMATLARTLKWGRWELRAAAGVGLLATQARISAETLNMDYYGYEASGVFGAAEASLVITRRLGRSWGIGLGPVLTFINEPFHDAAVGVEATRREAQIAMFGGLRYEL